MSEVVLVTGINGFTGRHMGRFLLDQNMTVVGLGRSSSPVITDDRLIYERCNLCDPQQVMDVFERYQFSYLIHLAGENSVPQAWREPIRTFQSNVVSTLFLLEAVRLLQPQIKRMLIVGSAQEYAPVTQTNVILNEQSAIRPTNPYGRSKRLQTTISQMFVQHDSLPIIFTRTFNLIGPEAKSGVCAQIAMQIVEMEHGLRPPTLLTGNLNIQRDFLDVRDAVTAYWSLLKRDALLSGETFNVCKGSSCSIGSLIEIFRTLSQVSFDVKSDPGLIRTEDVPVIRGDNSKLQVATGWKPVYSLGTSIADILYDLRQKEVIQ